MGQPCVSVVVCGFFFFKQKTAYEMRISDWSSDVCSSDLRQAEEIEQEVPGATVEQYGEGLVVQFDSKVLFDFDSYSLRAESKDAISQLAEVLNKYDSTEVVVEGHTDNVGTDSYKLRSEENTSELQSLMRISYAVFCLK